ncbi:MULTISPECIES: acetylornithine transaminase [Kitasatospora]|uniref:Acetylornithine aminotransferase n=1 Tax=Kitasatospora setae (strain ATCC 33774 / DSM 43861 / JCM 3304 / KCC A-0304 / NBRC 14216 / KM-6054) TaxID=452652 RepID=E4N7Y4_KITSK|nr:MULTISPECIES: acetylornithine transaminase [Kitasatospora]BAJ27315.1 putative acetylornithine aminotransferase [Kitasatospora setae KM-6054]
MSGNDSITARYQQSLMNNYGTPRIPLARGEGSYLWDADGTRYLDLVGGIAVNALGTAHPAIVEAVTRQITTLGHVSNLFMAEPTIELAEKLIELSGRPGKVFFCNSGTEANEAAFKISRLTGRTHLVSLQGAFHGRTMGALALTAQPAKQDPFKPLPGDVTYVPFGDVEALRAAVTTDTAAVFLEPIQGENGAIPLPDGYLEAAREITRATGTLLVLDEIQTGTGRTGHWFAHQAYEGVEPDVVTLAKGLGGGLPIGAVLAFGPAADLLGPGHHGTTFGGNPVVAAAGLAVLRTIEEQGLLEHAAKLGERLRSGVEAIGDPLVDHVRGKGLLLGIVLTAPVAARVQAAAQEAGFLVNAATADAVRLVPPLVLTEEQADAFLAALPAILRTVREAAPDANS